MNWPLGSATPFALSVVVGSGLLATCSSAEAATTVYELAQLTHFHGLAVVPAETSRLYLATHDGLFIVDPDGTAHPLSEMRDDLVGFVPHPTDPSILYASGHPAGGANLGVVVSTDSGRSWTQLSEGVGGPVDFHQMALSPADPKTIYGAYAGDLQVSKDEGRTWEVVGWTPEGLIDLAASSRDPSTLYAATQIGLVKSEDGGKTWQHAYWPRQPATMVHVTPDGTVYAFVVGVGLIETAEPELGWQTISKDGFGDVYILHLAVDPTSHSSLYAITLNPESKAWAVVVSNDTGKTWAPLSGPPTGRK
jgi:photosystem II stability/assembly factor-like uncharacterized protein